LEELKTTIFYFHIIDFAIRPQNSENKLLLRHMLSMFFKAAE